MLSDEGSKSESEILQIILGEETISSFFSSTYQIKPKLYPSKSLNKRGNDKTDLSHLLEIEYDEFCEFLQKSRELFSPSCAFSSVNPKNDKTESISPPLVFKNQIPLETTDIQNLYNSNPFAAYLDGCSLVHNHAQILSPKFFQLCQNLQKSFPHVFINSYLTPPHSQAVCAHADDRDVLVLQLLGKKKWKIFATVPIQHPYPEEQVGKYPHLPVPSSVLTGPILMDIVLHPGDVLYMPRGWVHEAFTFEDELSFHATIALATHDWTLARIVSEQFQKSLENIPQFRLALPRMMLANHNDIDKNHDDKKNGSIKRMHEQIQTEVDHIMQIAKRQITTDFISSRYQEKILRHNQHMNHLRNKIIPFLNKSSTSIPSSTSLSSSLSSLSSKMMMKVGPHASSLITLSSKIRASYPEERNFVPPTFDSLQRPRPSGVSIENDDICETLLSILKHLKDKIQTNRGQNNNDESTINNGDKHGCYVVSNIIHEIEMENNSVMKHCDMLSLISFVKCCVELGAMANISHLNG